MNCMLLTSSRFSESCRIIRPTADPYAVRFHPAALADNLHAGACRPVQRLPERRLRRVVGIKDIGIGKAFFIVLLSKLFMFFVRASCSVLLSCLEFPPQGIGKSTLIARLGGDWFSDSLSLYDIGQGKTAPEKLQGYWILEISELAGLYRAEIESLRSFLSRQNDIYRAAFGKRATPHLRQCIFFGTTNQEQGFLNDNTGNRRFWPVNTPGGGSKHSWELTQDEVKQIWAEAKYMCDNGERSVLDDEIELLAKQAQRNAMETDDREGLVVEYLNKLIPEDWLKMDVNARRGFLRDDPFVGGDKKGTVKRNSISVIEIWVECFGRDPSVIKKSDRNEILSILAKIGWKNGTSVNQRTPYGIQKCFFRPLDG